MGTRSSPITVGREGELDRIDRARDSAATGRPVIVLIRGEAGIGKTRLVNDAIERARAAGSPILHGACLDLAGEGLPYLPFVEALRNFVRATPPGRARELLGPARADLGRIVPEIGSLDGADARQATGRGSEGSATAESPDSTVDRARLFERFLGFLARLGADAPVFAVVEDVQWIDPATHDLITFLARNVTTERVVAVLTCRTGDLPAGHPVLAWLAELGRSPQAERIELGRLSRADLERQLEAMSGEALPAEVVRSIWKRSEGHPLFAEELLAAAGERAGETAHPPVPPSLVDVMVSRTARLDEETLATVRALAVAGGPVDERLLALVVGRPSRQIGTALRAATGQGVLTTLADGRHAFRHELLREVVERDLSISERRELHEAFARRLEARPDLAGDWPAGTTAELARHWAAADRPVEAHRAALAAAAAAEAVHAFADAHRQFERAMALEPRLPPEAGPTEPERIDVRRRAATVADLGGDWNRAVVLTREALALAEAGSDPLPTGLLHARLGFLIWAGGDGEAALGEHRRAVELVPAEPPSAERAVVLGHLGGALMGLGRWAESRPICEAAIACAITSDATVAESRARTMLGSDLVALGDIEAGLDELRRAHELAGREPTELWVVTGHNLGLNLLASDRLEEALAVATRTRDGTRAGGLERRYGMELAALVGDTLTRLGRWDEADRATLDGLALDQRGQGTPYLAVVRARLVAQRGGTAEARERLAAVDRERLEPDLAVVHGFVSAEVALLDGRPEDALEAVERVFDAFLATGDVLWGVPLVAFGLRAAAERAEALRAGRDEAGVSALLERTAAIRAAAAGLRTRVMTPSSAAWLATAEAETSRLDQLIDPQPWARASAAWDLAREPGEAAYARYRFAETELRRSGIRGDVATELVAAWRSAVGLGAVWLRDAIEVLARRARISLPADAADAADAGPEAVPAGAPGEAGATGSAAGSSRAGRPRPGQVGVVRPAPTTHGLSAREIEVLRLVAAGRSNGEIGDELFITRKTAGVHVTHILDKLGVSNRVEAAMAAARLGLLEPDSSPAPDSVVR